MISNVMHEKIKQLVCEHLGFDISDISVTEITGGTNNCFFIAKDNEKYYLRLPGGSSLMLVMRRDIELAVLKTVSSTGIGPEIVFFSEADGTMITRHIDGKRLSQRKFSSFETIKKTVETLKKIHNLPSVPYSFSPFNQIRDRINLAKQRDISLPKDLDNLIKRMDKIEKEGVIISEKFIGLCHNDLFVSNFIFAESVRILDWEFSGMGDIFYDLATMSMYFSKMKRRYMLKCYFGKPARQYYEHLIDMVFVAYLWNAMWAVTQAGEVENGTNFRYMADAFFEGTKEISFMELCLIKSQIPRAYRKFRRILVSKKLFSAVF